MDWSHIASVYGTAFVYILYKRVTLLSWSAKSWELFSVMFTNFVLLLNGSKGSIVGHWVKAEQPVRFVQGNNDLLLLTQTVGLQVKILLPIFFLLLFFWQLTVIIFDFMTQNYGAFLEKDGAGFRGKAKLTGFKNGDVDLSKSSWTYQVWILISFSRFI